MSKTIDAIINDLFPLTGIVMHDAVNNIQRNAARKTIEAMRDNGWKPDENIMQLHKTIEKQDDQIKKLTDELKVLEGIRNHLATENEKLKAAKTISKEDQDRIINNRVERAIAEANQRRDYGTDNPFVAEERKRLYLAERIRTTMNLQNKTMEPQLLTHSVVYRFAKSGAPVIFYQADGRSMFMRWRDFYQFSMLTGRFNPDPYTHFTVVPSCTLEDLTHETLCKDCSHFSEENIKCTLPACIKTKEGITEEANNEAK